MSILAHAPARERCVPRCAGASPAWGSLLVADKVASPAEGARRETRRFVMWINFFGGKQRYNMPWLGTAGPPVPRRPAPGQNKPTDRSPERLRLGVSFLAAPGVRNATAIVIPRPALPPLPHGSEWSCG
jgi:hypothetical protein